MAVDLEPVQRAGIVLSVALAALALPSCRVARDPAPARIDLARPIPLVAQRRWRVEDAGQLFGHVLEFESAPERDRPAGRCFSVRNELEQELGLIDGLGRAWRYQLHEREPQWVATGTLLEGALAILRAPANARLVEASVPIPEATR